MTDKTNPAGSKPDHVLGAELERDVLAALPLLVRLAVKVCRCSHLETEHNLTPTGRRTGCSHLAGAGVCACLAFEHTVDRYAASTYVDTAPGAPAPDLVLRDHRGNLLAP